MLSRLGYPSAHVTMAADRRSVEAAIPSGTACRARGAGADTAERLLGGGRAPRVRLLVDGVGLSRYVRERCAAPRLVPAPGARGRLVYARSGTGYAETPAFHVRSRSFAVTYSFAGGPAQVLIAREGDARTPPIQVRQGGRGRRDLPGPGRVRLGIAGTGRWQVRVYERR